MNEILRSFHHDESGATSTEYIIVLILIACIIIGIVGAFGSVLFNKFEDAKEDVRRDVTTN
jgi:pilus assembly protein Flp/PilA